MSDPAFSREGRVAVAGGEIWYGICGTLGAGGAPLLAIHGGPGMTHDYLRPLADLADARAVIFYDQLDAGRSSRPNDPVNWRIARFLSEIDALRAALDLGRLHVFGNSWGGTLAAGYAAAGAEGLLSVTLSSPLLHTDTWLADNAVHRDALPPDIVATMLHCEAAGQTDSPAYVDAVDLFYRRHLCRVTPWPEDVERTFEMMNETCYRGMWGPNEFTCTGVLRGYDGTADLPCIAVPTLVTCGAHDEATPVSTGAFAARIPGAAFEVFAEASHMAFVEVRAAYIARLRAFLAQTEPG